MGRQGSGPARSPLHSPDTSADLSISPILQEHMECGNAVEARQAPLVTKISSYRPEVQERRPVGLCLPEDLLYDNEEGCDPSRFRVFGVHASGPRLSLQTHLLASPTQNGFNIEQAETNPTVLPKHFLVAQHF